MKSALRDAQELFVGLYRAMVLIRGFEDLVNRLFLRGEIYRTTRTSTPDRRLSPSVSPSVLEERDRLAATYRGHGHALALGVDPQALRHAQCSGRATGINSGRAGSMNINSRKTVDRLVRHRRPGRSRQQPASGSALSA